MKLILCVDERNGYQLFKKRQTSDLFVLQRISVIVKDKPLWVTSYTKKLFDKNNIVISNIKVSDNPQQDAGSEDFIFVETGDITAEPSEIYLFNWNRHYHSEKHFVVDKQKYECRYEIEFSGKSHEKISYQEFIKK